MPQLTHIQRAVALTLLETSNITSVPMLQEELKAEANVGAAHPARLPAETVRLHAEAAAADAKGNRTKY